MDTEAQSGVSGEFTVTGPEPQRGVSRLLSSCSSSEAFKAALSTRAEVDAHVTCPLPFQLLQ